MSLKLILPIALAALVASAQPAAAHEQRPGPVLSHDGFDELENKLGMLGLLGLIGLFGLRRGDRRR